MVSHRNNSWAADMGRSYQLLATGSRDKTVKLWALQRAGNGGAEEARKMLSVALPERPPQYEEKPGTPGGTPGGVSKAAEYIPSASLETEYWRRASNRAATSQLTLTAPPTPV